MDFGARFRASASPATALTAVVAALPLALAASASAQQPAWTVEAHTGPVRELSFDATEGTWMSVDIAPDGTTITFDLLGTIYEMPAAGGAAVALTSGRSWNLSPRYSPDGRQIAFSSDRSGSHQIWVLDRASHSRERGGGRRPEPTRSTRPGRRPPIPHHRQRSGQRRPPAAG